MEQQSKIRWPKEFHPGVTAVHVSNELEMSATPEAVWECLIRAEYWPSWYVNAKKVAIRRGPRTALASGSVFRWRTFGVAIESKVAEFVPNERIAWTAEGLGVHAYHAWLIERTDAGCRVLTEETQNGSLARLGNWLMPNRMHKYHQIWLEALARRAETSSPLSAA